MWVLELIMMNGTHILTKHLSDETQNDININRYMDTNSPRCYQLRIKQYTIADQAPSLFLSPKKIIMRSAAVGNAITIGVN